LTSIAARESVGALRHYLERLPDERVLKPGTEAAIGQRSDPMPEDDVGAYLGL
jgi:hypothetical protein